jgi:tetratricopeptide (TPR) repeat protein
LVALSTDSQKHEVSMGQKTSARDQDALYRLMDWARGIRGSDPVTALNIFTVLKDQPSPVQDVCQQQYAISLLQTGQFDEALATLQQLVNSYTEPTSFRAYCLLHLAETAAAMGQLEQIAGWLEEADKISDRQRDYVLQGKIKQQRALVAAENGDYAKALERIEEGIRMASEWSTPTKGDPMATANRVLSSSII